MFAHQLKTLVLSFITIATLSTTALAGAEINIHSPSEGAGYWAGKVTFCIGAGIQPEEGQSDGIRPEIDTYYGRAILTDHEDGSIRVVLFPIRLGKTVCRKIPLDPGSYTISVFLLGDSRYGDVMSEDSVDFSVSGPVMPRLPNQRRP